ncbi:MAG TPA: FtsX-like permease family protein [Actinospica sp.]|nr:FtsX-like permease family protein [Actinospica sp.]
MWKVTVRGLLSHRLRLALTALAIVLGVAFVAGTYVFTDTLNATFSTVFNQVTKGIDVAVRTQAGYTSAQGATVRDPMPAALRDRIAAIDGVQLADGSVGGYAQFVGKNGKPVTTGGAPTIGMSYSRYPQLRAAGTLREGRLPTGAGQVAVDAATARNQGFHVGDKVTILFQGPPRTFTVTGIIGFGQADNLAGATIAAFDLPTAQQLMDRVGKYDEIDVVAKPGISAAALRDRIQAQIGPGYQVLTGQQLAQDDVKTVGAFTGFINYALLAFAAVALFVGSFIIVNTYGIILAQRTRELALLRCIGASRAQLLRSVLGESLIVAVLASAAGFGLGVLFAVALEAVFRAVGMSMPTTGLQIEPRTVVISFLVGVLVTVGAALVPALKATRVAPVEGLREGTATERAHASAWRAIIGSVLVAAGVGLLLTGLFTAVGSRLADISAGTVFVFLGAGVLSPLIARPLARVLGWPFAHWAGEPGRLAGDNARRNPRRTAATAAALMIGLGLVGFVTIFASSVKVSVNGVLDRSVTADYVLTGAGTSSPGFSPQVVAGLHHRPEIATATGVRAGVFKLDGATQQLFGIDPATFTRVVRTDMVSGQLGALTTGGVAVRQDVAASHGWKLGQSIAMDFPVGGVRTERIEAVYADNHLDGPYLLPLAEYQQRYPDQFDVLALVKAKPTVSAADSRAAVEQVTRDFPSVQVRDQAEYRQQQADQVNQLLTLFYALLVLAIVIAFLGIVNTLALSVLERVREIGLLRALGMTRRQLRAMIRWEAVIIALLGAVLGLVIGIFFGWTLVRALHGQGVTDFSLPLSTLLAFVGLAALAAVVAAILPGRHAARTDVLKAITSE